MNHLKEADGLRRTWPANAEKTVVVQPFQPLDSSCIAEKCSLGCPQLDSFLRGGVPCGSITELVGESTTGKSQLCLQLALAAQLPTSKGGLKGSALYFYTEGHFPYKRLVGLSQSFRHSEPLEALIQDTDVTSGAKISYKGQLAGQESNEVTSGRRDPCDNIFVQGLHTPDELLAVLENQLLGHLRLPLALPIRIIIIDSMAALFRTEYDNNVGEYTQRSDMFFSISKLLKKIAAKYDIAVVVTNQVLEHMDVDKGRASSDSQIGNLEVFFTSGRRVIPALGLAWANCVTTRLFLSRLRLGVEHSGTSNDRRRVQLVFAPHLPPSSCDYTITKSGLKGLESTSSL